MFIPNFDLYKSYEEAEYVNHSPYIAVFEKNGKTLLYLADSHGKNVSFDMVDFCFSETAPSKPKITVVEFECGKKIRPSDYQINTMIYAVGISAKLGIPHVYSDLSSSDMLNILNQRHLGRNFIDSDLNKILSSDPKTTGDEYNLLSNDLNTNGRDPFMIKNIIDALNKHDVVLAVFGEGHYRSHRLILEDLMGKPEYIKSVPNTRSANIKMV